MRAIAVLLAVVLVTPAIAGDLPDAKKTPGLADPTLTQARLCSKAFRTGSVRHVSATTKRKLYAAYGMLPKRAPCPCEIDHLIPLEIGGSDDRQNLWPQSYTTKPYNAHVKDNLENKLRKLVCAGTLDLKTAQRAISDDWIAAYRKYLNKSMRVQ